MFEFATLCAAGYIEVDALAEPWAVRSKSFEPGVESLPGRGTGRIPVLLLDEWAVDTS